MFKAITAISGAAEMAEESAGDKYSYSVREQIRSSKSGFGSKEDI